MVTNHKECLVITKSNKDLSWSFFFILCYSSSIVITHFHPLPIVTFPSKSALFVVNPNRKLLCFIVIRSQLWSFVVNCGQSWSLLRNRYDWSWYHYDLSHPHYDKTNRSQDFDMFEILTMIIFVVVQAKLTSNDYKWLGTTNDYKKWIRGQSWPELPICEWGISI